MSEGTPGYLTPHNIVVVPIPYSGGENGKDIEITIISHQYPQRFRNLERINTQIFKEIGLLLSDYDRNISWFVWTLLAPSAFMSSSMLDQKTGGADGLPRN